MAEALIKAVDFVHPDPEIDKRGAHKRGDIIVIKPDGWNWGGAERDPSKFAIVTVPDEWMDSGKEAPMTENIAERQSIALLRMKKLSKLASRKQERETLVRHRYAVDLENGNQLIDKRNT